MVVTWMVRLVAGVFCVMLLLIAIGNALTGSTSFWWEDVISASLVFLVFAHWPRTRIVYNADVGGGESQAVAQTWKKVRQVSTVLLVFSAVFVGLAALSVLTVPSNSFVTFPYVESRIPTRALLGFSLVVYAAVGVVGVGLRERRPFARIAAIVVGLLFFSRFPFGTALAAYTWWVLASPDVKEAFRPTESPMVSPDELAMAEGEP